MRGRGPLILISDLLDPGYLDALRDLAGTRCQLSVLHLLAPDELEPEVPPDARLVDNETGHASRSPATTTSSTATARGSPSGRTRSLRS